MQKQNILRYSSLKSANPPPFKNQPLFQNSIIFTKTKDDFTKISDTAYNAHTKNARLLTEGAQPYNKNQPFLYINSNHQKGERQPQQKKLKEEEKINFDPTGQRLQKKISEKHFKFVGNYIPLKKQDYTRKEKPTECFWIKKDASSKVYNNFLESRVNTEQNPKPTKESNALVVGPQCWNLRPSKVYDNKPSTEYIKRNVKTQNDEAFCETFKMQDHSTGQFYRKSLKNAIRKTQTDEDPSKNFDFRLCATFNMVKSDKNNQRPQKMSFEKVFITKENRTSQQNKENRKTTCVRDKTALGGERQRYTTNLNDQRLTKSPSNIKPFTKNQSIIQENAQVTDLQIESLNNGKYLVQKQPKKTRMSTENNKMECNHQKHRVSKKNEGDSVSRKPVDWKRQLVMMEKIGEGTFGKVYRAKLRQESQKQIYAIKKVYIDKKYKSRQLEIVQELSHPQVMKVHSVFVTSKDLNEQYLNIVMDYYDRNLFEVISGWKEAAMGKSHELQQKVLIYQILKGLSYVHSLKICHRDIKPHNMLVKGWELVLCDFGSAKRLIAGEENLSYICSRCYRAPELIFGSTSYSTQIDMWSVACVIVEMLHGLPLFIGQNSLDHLLEVIKVVGTPSKQEVLQMNSQYDISEYDLPIIKRKSFSRLFPKADPKLIDLVNKLMVYNPHERLTAIEALAHNYFDDLRREETFKVLENQLPREKLENMFGFSEKEMELCHKASDWRKKQSKGLTRGVQSGSIKKPNEITQTLTPLWWRLKRQV